MGASLIELMKFDMGGSGATLGTAKAMMATAVVPALTSAGLPTSSIVLIESRAHAAGWALFADHRLSLAVARGSGPAVEQLGGDGNMTVASAQHLEDVLGLVTKYAQALLPANGTDDDGDDGDGFISL